VATQDLARDVEALLKRPVFVSASLADVSVEGHIEPRPKGGFRANISVRDSKGAELGTREIEGPGACSEMREELGIVVAVMIDPDAMSRASSSPAPPTADPMPVPVMPAPAPAPPPAPKPEAPVSRWHLDAGTSLAGEVGLMPNPALGVRADALLTPPRWIPLEGYAAIWPYDSSTHGPLHGELTVGWLGGGLCPLHFLGRRWLFYGCASGIVGIAVSEGNGTPNGPSPILAAAIEGRASLRVGGPFSVRVGVSGVIPILRPSYGTGGNPIELYHLTALAAVADVGMGVVF
jgi:hypothetical protein